MALERVSVRRNVTGVNTERLCWRSQMSKALKPWALVTGAGGFIGHHLVSYLKAAGYRVRGVDIKRPEYSAAAASLAQ